MGRKEVKNCIPEIAPCDYIVICTGCLPLCHGNIKKGDSKEDLPQAFFLSGCETGCKPILHIIDAKYAEKVIHEKRKTWNMTTYQIFVDWMHGTFGCKEQKIRHI